MPTHVFVQVLSGEALGGLVLDPRQEEYKRLVKKFKSSCPTLFSPVRMFIKRCVAVRVHTSPNVLTCVRVGVGM